MVSQAQAPRDGLQRGSVEGGEDHLVLDDAPKLFHVAIGEPLEAVRVDLGDELCVLHVNVKVIPQGVDELLVLAGAGDDARFNLSVVSR